MYAACADASVKRSFRVPMVPPVDASSGVSRVLPSIGPVVSNRVSID